MTLTLRTIPARHLDPRKSDEILALCSAAYEEDFGQYAELFSDPVHVLAEEDGRLVSRAVDRTHPRSGPPAATAHRLRGSRGRPARSQGAATARPSCPLGRRHQDGCDLALVNPSDPAFYAASAGSCGRGPLLVRTGAGESAGEEEALILRLPATPPLDLTWSLSVEWRPIEPW
ncbi:MAG: hypothetical protein R2838_09035 [Caldilineaceae bacterium]